MSLHTRHTCQRAIASFIKAATIQIGDGGQFYALTNFPATFDDPENAGGFVDATVGVHIACGAINDDGSLPAIWTELRLPAIIVNSVSSSPNDAGYEVCDVSIFSMTTVEEINAPTAVDRRAGWLEALFNEDNLVQIAADLTASTTVANFTCIGIVRDGTVYAQRGDHVLSGLRLKVHCAAR